LNDNIFRQLNDANDELNSLVNACHQKFTDLQDNNTKEHNSIDSSINKLTTINVTIQNLQRKVDSFKTEFLGQEQGKC
jgi:uncharacterized coiled-coil DUF342 family protein